METRVCTLRQAQCLVSLGVILDAVWCWFDEGKYGWMIYESDELFKMDTGTHSYPAPNSDELIAEIPSDININGQSYNLIFRKATEKGRDIYICDVVDAVDKNDWYFDFKNDHLAWLLADVLIWLKNTDNKTELEDMIIQNAINEAELIERMHRQ